MRDRLDCLDVQHSSVLEVTSHPHYLTPVERVAGTPPPRPEPLPAVEAQGQGVRTNDVVRAQRPRRGEQDGLFPLTLRTAGTSSGRQERQPPQGSSKILSPRRL
jgi:hypothetical protein